MTSLIKYYVCSLIKSIGSFYLFFNSHVEENENKFFFQHFLQILHLINQNIIHDWLIIRDKSTPRDYRRRMWLKLSERYTRVPMSRQYFDEYIYLRVAYICLCCPCCQYIRICMQLYNLYHSLHYILEGGAFH